MDYYDCNINIVIFGYTLYIILKTKNSRGTDMRLIDTPKNNIDNPCNYIKNVCSETRKSSQKIHLIVINHHATVMNHIIHLMNVQKKIHVISIFMIFQMNYQKKVIKKIKI